MPDEVIRMFKNPWGENHVGGNGKLAINLPVLY